MIQFIRRIGRLLLPALLCITGWVAQAAPVLITVDTSQLAGTSGQFAFDLIDGGAPANTVTLRSFSGNATFGGSSATGGVVGSVLSTVTLSDTSFFSEYVQNLVFGSIFLFVLDTSGNAAIGFAPDAFSLFVLDSTGAPLGISTDPTGANSLFLLNIGNTQGLQLFDSTVVNLTAQAEPAGTVPEPRSAFLVAIGLFALFFFAKSPGIARRLRISAAVGLSVVAAQGALAADLTALVSITKTGFVLNRTSNTFDTVVTVRNLSSDTLAGPMQVTLENASPADVALYNSYGRNATDKDFVLLPLPNGVLASGASASVPVKLINTGRAVTNAQLSVQGTQLTAATSGTLKINAFFADGANGTLKGASVGAGFTVTVDGYARGVTDTTGSLTIVIPTSAKTVSVKQIPNSAGTAAVGALSAGQVKSVDVLVGDGGEVYGDGVLRIDQVQQFLLARNASRISMRLMRDEKPIKVSTVSFVQVTNVVGGVTDLTSLFSIQSDGSVGAAGVAFYQALSGFSGKAVVALDGEDADGVPVRGTAAFYLSDYRTRVQLVAPPSRPGLSLAGVRIAVNILNTSILVRAESDASGMITLPDLPRGNISLDSSISVGGVIYAGSGTAVLNKNSLVKLTMRAPVDVLNNVPAISIEPLPSGLAALQASYGAFGSNATSSEKQVYTQRQLSERLAYGQTKLASAGALSKSGRALALAATDPLSVSVSVTAGAQDAQIEQSAQLKVPKGTKKLVLTYTVQSDEYPYYVTAQSIYNDVWSLSVLDAGGASLYSITRQVNSQLTQDPVWLSDSTTGQIKKEFDVTAIAASADVNVIVRATAVNIGDDQLPTRVVAKLDAGPQLVIGTITPDEVNSVNDSTFYGIPRPGATNTYQRQFKVEISKPQGATLSTVGIELRSDADASLMQLLPDTAPGQDGVEVVSQDDTKATLNVRVTLSTLASTVAGAPPPTRDLTYRIKAKGTDANGAALSDQKDVTGKRSLWRMPDGIARYGSRDVGGDDWAARGTYNWLTANLSLIRPINDISGEHGIDLGHLTHARGTDIDTYHFYLFPGIGTGPGQGLANFNSLKADVIAAFATLGTPPISPEATAAKGRVAAWVTATRTGLTNLAANAAVATVIHCSGPASQGLLAGWCRALLTTGKATRTTVVLNAPPLVQTVDFGGGVYTNSKMVNNNIHNDHIHITLAPGQIAE